MHHSWYVARIIPARATTGQLEPSNDLKVTQALPSEQRVLRAATRRAAVVPWQQNRIQGAGRQSGKAAVRRARSRRTDPRLVTKSRDHEARRP
jgi:hypothetical protein